MRACPRGSGHHAQVGTEPSTPVRLNYHKLTLRRNSCFFRVVSASRAGRIAVLGGSADLALWAKAGGPGTLRAARLHSCWVALPASLSRAWPRLTSLA